MKIKKEKVKYEKKLKVVDKVPKKIIDYKWLLIIWNKNIITLA